VLLDYNADVMAKSEGNDYALHLAAQKNHLVSAELLLKAKADPWLFRDADGDYNPLIVAATKVCGICSAS